jgi:hypothetical protein
LRRGKKSENIWATRVAQPMWPDTGVPTASYTHTASRATACPRCVRGEGEQVHA